jgi:hypothetical protein
VCEGTTSFAGAGRKVELISAPVTFVVELSSETKKSQFVAEPSLFSRLRQVRFLRFPRPVT